MNEDIISGSSSASGELKGDGLEDLTLGAAFEAACLASAQETAIRFYRDGRLETALKFSELNSVVNRCCHLLLDAGVREGDRVALYLPKSLIFVVAYLAAQKIGAICVPWNEGFKSDELAYLLRDADPRLVIAGRSGAATLQALAPQTRLLPVDADRPFQQWKLISEFPDRDPEIALDPEQTVLILYTSGTTGDPKGAALTHRNLLHNIRNIIRVWEIHTSDVMCHALPIFHIHGLVFALQTCLLANAETRMLDHFSPSHVLDLLGDRRPGERCTIFMAVPTMYAKLMGFLGDERPDFGHVRLWTSGSAPLRPADFERVKMTFGKEPVEREGMSETGMNFSNPVHGIRKPGSIGLPLPGLEVRIVDPHSHDDLPPGETGEIWLRGPAVTPGYWRKPAETRAAFVGGWFRTGDLGRQAEDGYFYLTDRLKHIIISGGENISPKQIEAVIDRLKGVAESSVVGIPDPVWGERVVAAVAPKPGVDLDRARIIAHCQEYLHDWKCPKQVRIIPALPKNSMGKVRKAEVERLFVGSGGDPNSLEDASGAEPAPPASP
jgi:malonyl-CoA/methylmalonyl-CoA synthetase